jgi:hypothetical protein
LEMTPYEGPFDSQIYFGLCRALFQSERPAELTPLPVLKTLEGIGLSSCQSTKSNRQIILNGISGVGSIKHSAVRSGR